MNNTGKIIGAIFFMSLFVLFVCPSEGDLDVYKGPRGTVYWLAVSAIRK